MASISEALAIATQHHQAGRLAEAENIYRQILAVEPDHPAVLHQLGMLAAQARHFEAAVDLIGRAIRVDRTQPAFHANLGEAYRHLGKTAEAAECYRHAIKLHPQFVQAHTMLGIVLHLQGKPAEAIASFREALRLNPENIQARMELGLALDQQNKWTEAEACFRRILRTDHRSAEAHFNLGAVLQSQNRLDEAAASYRTALEIDPRHVSAYNNLGTILKAQNHLDQAIAQYQAALQIQPDHAAAHTNLAVAYELSGQHEAAAASYQAALRIDPKSAPAWQGLGAMLLKQGQLEQAISSFSEAVRLEPDHVPWRLSLGYALQTQGRFASAAACYSEAVRIDPQCHEAHNNLGVAWCKQGRLDESIAHCRRAIELRPDYAIAYSNLAVSLQSLGQLDEAIAAHRKSVELDPQGVGNYSNLLYALNYHPDHDAAALFAEHRAWGMRHADPLTAAAAPHDNDRSPDRRLRIGYVSPHFMAHAVNFFSEPILASHDHAQFEVFCYSDVFQGDETTARLRGYSDQWRDTVGQSDQQVAESIRRDKIDILVDLTGHINGGKRMLVFARKPAPIQVTYIGYQNTTGMTAMDYRLTDDYSDPPGLTDAFHTESLVRLPRLFYTYLPDPAAPPVNPLPALANGHITFASINHFAKVTPEVLNTWAQLLLRLPGSRLILRADMTDFLRRHLLQWFATHGIGPERLDLINRLPRNEYLELIRRADIALDPFPFNGHTTTCDCLWQGVPVVTLTGQTYVSRFGGSGLVVMGLSDLIAQSPGQYLEIAASLANDVDRLTQLRGSLRERMAVSPLLDAPGFTRNLEAAYRQMWARWCAK